MGHGLLQKKKWDMDVPERFPPWLRSFKPWRALAGPSSLIFFLTLTVIGFTWIRTRPLPPPHLAAVEDQRPFPLPPPTPTPPYTSSSDPASCAGFYRPPGRPRRVVRSILEYGGVGDGATSNTEAFRKAVEHLKGFGGDGGAQLNVPVGRWLTGSFNLTSNFTLFLEEGAIILGSQDPKEWPLIEPLPSYGRGRERPGSRHISLIHGHHLNDLVITGQNGTIDGQGRMWWELWWNRTLEHTRGHLVELLHSNNILISNLTFLNSPFWTIHPVYCSNVVIKDMTVLAPLNAPNTDGIDPDSSTNVCIQDCYIESGDDLVAVKSGWDQYGTAAARPSSNIIIRRISGTTPTCSGVGIGSEMSGGISNITIEDLHVWDSAAAIRLKTDRGRGGYIENISIANVKMERVKVPMRFSRGANDHPDGGYDRNALPRVKGLYVENVVGVDVGKGPVLEGIEGSPSERICLRNVSLSGRVGSSKPIKWVCEHVTGEVYDVSPLPCEELIRRNSTSSWCSKHWMVFS